MATFQADVPLNLWWRDPTTGIVVEVVSVKASGVPWPANTAFTVPDEVADAFESDMTGGTSTVRHPEWIDYGDRWTDPGPQPVAGRIPGLERL